MVEALLEALAASDVASALRASRWGYAALNTTHVFALATLFGAVLALDLRLVFGVPPATADPERMAAGVWAAAVWRDTLRWLSTIAAVGLGAALASGFLLFAVRAPEYAALGVFRAKLALILVGTSLAIAVQASGGPAVRSRAARRAIGLLSLVCWSGALVCGRLVAFVGD